MLNFNYCILLNLFRNIEIQAWFSDGLLTWVTHASKSTSVKPRRASYRLVTALWPFGWLTVFNRWVWVPRSTVNPIPKDFSPFTPLQIKLPTFNSIHQFKHTRHGPSAAQTAPIRGEWDFASDSTSSSSLGPWPKCLGKCSFRGIMAQVIANKRLNWSRDMNINGIWGCVLQFYGSI